MKKIFFLLSLLMCFSIEQVLGDEMYFYPSDFTSQGTSVSGSAISATVSGITFACDKGYGTTQIRCYTGSTITISSSTATINSITFGFSNSNTGGLSELYTKLNTTSWSRTLSGVAHITGIYITFTPRVTTIRDGLSEGKWGTICPKQEVQQPEGALFYTLNHMDYTNEGAPYKFYFDELSAGTSLEAGKPYLFVAGGTEIRGIKSGEPVDDGEYAYNGFVGHIGTSISLASDYDTYTAGSNNYYGLFNNQFTLISSGSNIASGRAYIEISPTRQPASTQQPAPAYCSGRRLVVGAGAPSVATGVDNTAITETPSKMIIDGTMYILRGEKLYDAIGRIVK